jgi:hypothetical protein
MNKREMLAAIDSEILCVDGWDEHILGTAFSPGRQLLAVYDGDGIINTLVRGGLSFEEAAEHFEFNIEGAWLGPRTPVFVRGLGPEDIETGEVE